MGRLTSVTLGITSSAFLATSDTAGGEGASLATSSAASDGDGAKARSPPNTPFFSASPAGAVGVAASTFLATAGAASSIF